MPASSTTPIIPISMDFVMTKHAPRRLEDEFNASNLVRCQDVWYTDGNIILALLNVPNAPATQAHVFRVHKSVLSQLSDVWRGLFALAQPSSEVETCAEVECVRFHGDNPDDMREFLQIVYCQSFLPNAPLQSWRTTERAVAGPLRIATKYGVSSLRDRIVQILEADWPSTLEGWNANEKITRLRMETLDLRDCFPEPASIIRLARDCNIPSILPAAFYHANELIRENYSSNTPPERHQFELSLLSREDLHALIVGREAMRLFLSKWLMSMPINYASDEGPRCMAVGSPNAREDVQRCCDSIPMWWLSEFLEPGLAKLLWPIDFMELFAQELERDNRICGSCRSWLISHFKACTEHIWSRLPEWFLLQDVTTQ